MKAKNFLFVILIIFLLFFSFSIGFYLGSKKAKVGEKEVVKVLEPKASKLVEKRYYSITGFVKEIDYQNHIVTLTMDGDEMKLKIGEDKVKSFSSRHRFVGEADATGAHDVTFKDILVGDKLTTFTEEEKNGELIGTGTYIHSEPE
jgi:hypothetical protein